MIYSGAFSLLLSGSISGSCDPTILQNEPDTGIRRLILALIYVISLGLLILRWKRVFYLISQNQNMSVLSLVGLALVSSLWSENFSATLTPAIALFGSTLFGLYFGSRYPLQKQLQLLGWALGIAGLLSLIFALAFPSIGTMCSQEGVQGGAWRGIYIEKNSLGRMMELSTIIFLLLIKFRRFRLLTWLGLSGSLLLLILSTSTSALIISIVLIILLPIYQYLRLREDILAPVILSIAIVLICSFVLFFYHAESIVGYFGKDLTLTGRTVLWRMCLKMIQQRIFLGYGFKSFWGEDWDSPGEYVRRAVGWPTPHAHNGLIELGLDLGLLGIIIFVAGYLINLVRAFIWVRLTRSSAGLWPLLYLSFLFLANTTESSLLRRNSIFWVLYVALTLSLSIPPVKKAISVDKINRFPDRQLELKQF